MSASKSSPHRRFFIRPAVRKSAKRNRTAVCGTRRAPAEYASSQHRPQNFSMNMSSITPQSFVDDGGSFTKRIPRGLDDRHVAKWITSNSSDTSAYTGSFLDDGADMHQPPGADPGFGPIDTRFYRQKKRKEPKDDAGMMWNDDVQRAISGDIQRNLEKIRGLGGLEVKKAEYKDCGDEKVVGQEQVEKDTVRIPIPPQWGTFIIKAGHGRVIVVDKDGEFDSGPQKAASEQQRPWVKAASTVKPASLVQDSSLPSPPKHRTSTGLSQEQSKRNRDQKTRSDKKEKSEKTRQPHHSRSKALTPIPESDYEDGYLPSSGEDIGSPTGFMMTGGAGGWPSSRSTSVASPAISVMNGYEYIVQGSPIKAISEGFRHVTPGSRVYKPVVRKPDSWFEEKKSSPVRSLPGGWPSPELSLVKEDGKAVSKRSWDGGQFESAWKAASLSHSHKSAGSHPNSRSDKSQNSIKDFDDASVKSHSTYKAPTVEDAPSTASEEKEDYIATGWGGSVRSSGTQDWSGNKKSADSAKKDKQSGWTSPLNTPHPHTRVGGKAPSEQSWSHRPKAADNPSWTGIEPFESQKRVNSPSSPQFCSPVRPSSDDGWDGFERRKGLSDVSVVGTESEREPLGHHSRVSSNPSARRSHRSHDTRTSHRRNRPAQPTGWEDGQPGWPSGSQTSRKIRHSHQPDATTAWPGSHVASEASWNSNKAHVDHGNDDDWGGGEKDKGQYANGFDEDNATYLNDNWGGIPVRVGSRAGSKSSRQSGAGWD